MDTMDCRQARNLLSDFQDGTMEAAAATGLAAHLRGCGECASADASLHAVRELLRELPPDPAPPELFASVLAAVEAEDRNARPGSTPGGAAGTRPFLSRFRVLLEASVAVLLVASVYWYQRTPAPVSHSPSVLSSNQSPEAGTVSSSRPMAAKEDAAKSSPSVIRLPRETPKEAKEEVPAAPRPRTWTAESLPSVPALRASTDSERIVPIAPFPGPTADPAEGGADFRLSRSFAPPPSRLLRPLPYGRDIVLDVNPESREGAEERIAEAALRSGGIFERIERESDSERNGAAGTIRVILPEAAAVGFIEELRRIGNVPKEYLPSEIDIPAGPRPGTIAYAVRIRVR
jgi:hypothetical protein